MAPSMPASQTLLIRFAITFLSSLVILSSATAATAQFTFQRILDQSTPVPGHNTTFDYLGVPALDGQDFAFSGIESNGVRGIYKLVANQLTVVADTTTAIPLGTGVFSSFDPPSLDDGAVAFWAQGPSSQSGIYSDVGGSLVSRVNEDTFVPELGGTFSSFGRYPSMDAGTVAFSAIGQFNSQRGIYLASAGLSTVLNTEDGVPGSIQTFSNFSNPSLEAGVLSFIARGGGRDGVYLRQGGTLSVLADEDTILPGGTEPIVAFSTFAVLSGLDVAFVGASQNNRGVFRSSNGLNTEVDTSTVIPGGTGTFLSFAFGFEIGPALDCDVTVFIGTGSNSQKGIYVRNSSALLKVIDVSDTLDGMIITNLFISREAVSGNRIAFGVNFPGGSSSTVDEIWTATSNSVLCPGSAPSVSTGGPFSLVLLLGMLVATSTAAIVTFHRSDA